MTERGVPVDHTTIYRWVQKYAPELDKQTRWYRQVPDWQASSWRVDETYIGAVANCHEPDPLINAGGLLVPQHLADQCRNLINIELAREDDIGVDTIVLAKSFKESFCRFNLPFLLRT